MIHLRMWSPEDLFYFMKKELHGGYCTWKQDLQKTVIGGIELDLDCIEKIFWESAISPHQVSPAQARQYILYTAADR